MTKAIIFGKDIQMPNYLGYIVSGERLSTTIRFETKKRDGLENYTYSLTYVNSNNRGDTIALSKTVDNDFIYLTWTPDDCFTSVKGVVQVQITGVDYTTTVYNRVDFNNFDSTKTYYVDVSGTKTAISSLALYNTITSYSADDYCVYSNKLYKCLSSTTGTWDSTKWQETIGYEQGHPIWKTTVAQIRIATSLDPSAEMPNIPTIFEQYLEQMEEYAEDAEESASTAETFAVESEAWATGGTSGTPTGTNNAKYYSEQASSSASTASTQAGVATTKASEASSCASTASTQAVIATTKAGEASTSATTASTKASEASASATTASTKAGEASASATTATTQAGIATTKAQEASESAEEAQEYAEQVETAIATHNASTEAHSDIRTLVTNEATYRASADATLQGNIDTHTGNTSNPHSVTKAQVGLGNVPNTDFTSDITDLNSKKHNHSNKSELDLIAPGDKAKWDSKYNKPLTGIPKTDLASDVQTSLGKADTALQEHQSLTDYRKSADQDVIDNALDERIDDVEELIPSQASTTNLLADKDFVNSSIATETAHYISNNGEPFTSVAQLEAYSGTVTNNDYAFVSGTDSTGNAYYDRYKATVPKPAEASSVWAKEYRLNNSSFTAQQWASISSGITSVLVASYNSHIANTDIHTTTQEKATWNAKYDKPATGIPDTDLAEEHYTESEVDTLLNDKVSYQSFNAHANNTSNPHSVTKAQVGLGNVPNTDFTYTIADHETRISAIENSDSLIKVTAYHANAVISGLTVQVKQGSTVRYTGTTDANGKAEIRVANGNYTVHGVYDNDYTTVIDADVVAPKFGEVACRIVGLKDGEMTWSLFQQYVQDGSITSVLNIGGEVSVRRNNVEYAFRHVAFDKITTVDTTAHNSVIEMKDCFPDTALQFNAVQAIIHAYEAMPAGTYHFNLYKPGNIYNLNAGLHNKDVQFTIATPIPQGGQLVLTGGNFKDSTAVSQLVLSSYSTKASTTALESGIACSEGTSGTAIGNGYANQVTNRNWINSTDRCIYGSCEWRNSAVRQWLNSDQPRGSWWTPMSNFDRVPAQATSVDGFMYNLDADLKAVMKKIKSITNLNWFDGGGTCETEDWFIIPSYSQVYMTADTTEGAWWDYYITTGSPHTTADSYRIKKRGSSASYWWLRTPYSSDSATEYIVTTTGACSSATASRNGGVAPACCIA